MSPGYLRLSEKYTQMKDEALQKRERELFENPESEPEVNARETFLLEEWHKLLDCIDPHYHVVMELLLRGVIGSELEALLKRNIKSDEIQLRHKLSRETLQEKATLNGKEVLRKESKVYFGLKLKNWYRKRNIPVGAKLRKLLEEAMRRSVADTPRVFDNDVVLSAKDFVLTMKDGSPFDYNKFCKVWRKAMAEAGIPHRVPYAARHTLVQWALLIGITKNRLVSIMGHCNKGMIDNVYGAYRKGLVEEKERILDYLGEDFLALEELKVTFPEHYAARIAVVSQPLQMNKAPAMDATFGQSNGQNQELYPDNYKK